MRHVFLVDCLLDGVVLEVDASILGGSVACLHGDRRRSRHAPTDAFVAQFGLVRTKNCCTQGGETPLTKQHGKFS